MKNIIILIIITLLFTHGNFFSQFQIDNINLSEIKGANAQLRAFTKASGMYPQHSHIVSPCITFFKSQGISPVFNFTKVF